MHGAPSDKPERQPSDGRGHFFAIDRRVWAKACSLGMSAAVSYLVLARGTGGDNRTTSWSVNAIESHTGIGRPRAQKALKTLEGAGLVRIVKGGSRPRYFLLPAHEVPGVETGDSSLTSEEQAVLQYLSEYPHSKSTLGSTTTSGLPGVWNAHRIGCGLADKGYVRRHGTHTFQAASGNQQAGEIEQEPKPDWIWLPNEIVTGLDGVTPPVERIRSSQNLIALRVFIDLYHAQSLAIEGGVDWRPHKGIRQIYERVKVAQRGHWVVWGFRPLHVGSWDGAPLLAPHLDHSKEHSGEAFWAAWGILTGTGLVEMVAHLVESATVVDAEALHPLPYDNGEPGERAITYAAFDAARCLASEAQMKWAGEQGAVLFAPVEAHIAEVQVVGIARLLYRPRTKATSAWYAQASTWAEQARYYRDIVAKTQRTPNMQHQGEIKG